MNASKYRNTRFEIRLIQQGPNSFGLVCAIRGKFGEQAPPLEIPEEDFTDKEMKQVHDVLQLLEEKFTAIYDIHMANPENLVKELERSKAAHKAEIEKIKAEASAEKKSLEMELNKAKQANQGPVLIKLG